MKIALNNEILLQTFPFNPLIVNKNRKKSEINMRIVNLNICVHTFVLCCLSEAKDNLIKQLKKLYTHIYE